MNALAPINQDVVRAIDLSTHLRPSTRDKYKRAVEAALAAGLDLRDAPAVIAYADTVSTSVRNNLKSAIKIWSDNLANRIKSSATPETITAVQATLYRLDALNEAITVRKTANTKAHTWLTQSEVKRLLDMCNPATLRGQRDKVILGLLVGAGLRREELTGLKFADVVLQPIAGKFRTVLNVTGKGAKDRVVPINDRIATALDDWQALAGSAPSTALRTGYIARSVNKAGRLGDSLSAIGIFHIVRGAGERIGKPNLAPHNLRRTYAQLGYEAFVPITQISTLLGHASVATTQRYLNLDLDLQTTISDFIPF